MKKLTLIRHAKSDWNTAVNSDFERPLNQRGKTAAPLMGERLAGRGCQPDLLLSSPAKRARQTAKRVARQIGHPKDDIVYNQEIYEADLDTLTELIRELDDRYQEVMLFGHNPGFSELGEWLTPEAPEWLPTCGLLELELPIEHWEQVEQDCASLVLYDYPKKKS